MPDMQQQIDALREAFSADTTKPFVLKPSFPYGSPAAPVNLAASRLTNQYRPGGAQGGQNVHQQSMGQHHVQQSQTVSRYNHPISPPISVGAVTDMKSDSPAVQSLVMVPAGQRGAPTQSMNVAMSNEQSSWNPIKIFEYVDIVSHQPCIFAKCYLVNGITPLVRHKLPKVQQNQCL